MAVQRRGAEACMTYMVRETETCGFENEGILEQKEGLQMFHMIHEEK